MKGIPADNKYIREKVGTTVINKDHLKSSLYPGEKLTG